MSTGIFAGIALVATLFLEHTLFAAFPSPWHEIVLPLMFGIVIMYRVSLPLGAVFLLTAGIFGYSRGLAGFETVLAYAIATLSGVALSTRVFARRSLVALAGFALGTTFAFLAAKFLMTVGEEIIQGERVNLGTPVLHTIFIMFASTVGSVVISLVYTTLRENFGSRFIIRKDRSYEIQSRS